MNINILRSFDRVSYIEYTFKVGGATLNCWRAPCTVRLFSRDFRFFKYVWLNQGSANLWIKAIF